MKNLITAIFWIMSLSVPVYANPLEGHSCYNKAADRPGTIQHGECFAEPLQVSEEAKNREYGKNMVIGINLAAEKGDWNAAVLVFELAKEETNSQFEISEAERGIKAAKVAKYIQLHPGNAHGVTAYQAWVYISGCQAMED